MPVIADGHSDLAYELAYRRSEENPFAAHWLDHLEQGGVGVQVCAVGADLDQPVEGFLRVVLQQVSALHRASRENPGRAIFIRTRADLERAIDTKQVGLVLSMEGAEPIGRDLDLVDVFWELGARMVSLTWNRRNLLADGVGETSPGGLTDAGVRVVRRLVELGIVLDLAHASEATFDDVLREAPRAKLIVSHGACRAMHESPRNLRDEQMRELASRGGVLAVMSHPLAIDPSTPTIDRVVDHIAHSVSVMGIEHVGLGGDFMHRIESSGAVHAPLQPDAVVPSGFPRGSTIGGLKGPEDYPALVSVLRRRGFTGENLDAILGGNLLRLLRDALPS